MKPTAEREYERLLADLFEAREQGQDESATLDALDRAWFNLSRDEAARVNELSRRIADGQISEAEHVALVRARARILISLAWDLGRPSAKNRARIEEIREAVNRGDDPVAIVHRFCPTVDVFMTWDECVQKDADEREVMRAHNANVHAGRPCSATCDAQSAAIGFRGCLNPHGTVSP